MTLFQRTTSCHHPAQVHEVFDVSGAGDTVLATLAHFLAQGRPLDECAQLANRAAGIAVTKFGTAAVTLAELQAVEGKPLCREAPANEASMAPAGLPGLQPPAAGMEAAQ
jgi:bifunctional ADP-heptose synthase (sugar kinase/adenylyltransferase)